MIMKYDDTSPCHFPGIKGKGVRHPAAEQVKRTKNSMRKGFKVVFVHKSKFIQWAWKEKKMNEGNTDVEWQSMLDRADEEDLDQDGPADEPARVVIKIEDYVMRESNAELKIQWGWPLKPGRLPTRMTLTRWKLLKQ